jgi:hypothetical protein
MGNEKLKRDKKIFIWIINIFLFISWFLSQEPCIQFIKFLLGSKAKETLFGFPLALQIFSSVNFYIMSVFYTDEYNQITVSMRKGSLRRKVMVILFFLGDWLYRILVSLLMLLYKLIFALSDDQEGIKTVDDTHKSIMQRYDKYPIKLKTLCIALALSGLLFLIAYILELAAPEILQYYSKAIGLAVSLIGFFSIARSSTTYFLSRSNVVKENED